MYGRTTAKTCSWNKERMPNPEHGCVGLKNIFVDEIYSAFHDKVQTTERV
jgi:hypothetical protein